MAERRARLAAFLALVALAWLALLTSPRDARQDGPPPGVEVLDLRLKPKSVVRLRAALRHAREVGYRDAEVSAWVPGRLVADGEVLRCRLRLRGDASNHWQEEKFSLRVKLASDTAYRGAREFNLVIPWDQALFNDLVSEWWCRAMDLLPTPSRLVWVRLNGEDLGIYSCMEELGPELLERQGYPTAPLYKAQQAPHFEPPPRYVATPRVVYSRPFFRHKLPRAPNIDGVDALLAATLDTFRRDAPLDRHEVWRLSHLLDLERWASQSALCRLLGSHPETAHNVVIYFDSATGLFEPVFQDPEILDERPLDDFERSWQEGKSHNVFTRELLAVPEFLALRDRRLARVAGLEAPFLRWYGQLGRWSPILASDPLMRITTSGLVDPGAADAPLIHPTAAHIDAFGAAYLHSYRTSFGALRRYLEEGHPCPPPPIWRQPDAPPIGHATWSWVGEPAGPVLLTLRHDQDEPLRLTALEVEGPGADRVAVRSPPGAEVTRRSGRARLAWPAALPLPPRRDTTVTVEGFDPALQRLHLEAGDAEWAVAGAAATAHLRLEFLDRPVAESIAAASNLRCEVTPDAIVVPPGDYVVRAPLLLPRGRRLVLQAGVTLRFAPDASLVSYAPITIDGTLERPVVCRPLDPARGWGVLAVVSANAWSPADEDGPRDRTSHVRGLALTGARGTTLNGITYTGGLAFLGSDVELDRSLLTNVGGDDALNVKAAHVVVRACAFLDSPSDAVDLDSCAGAVERSLLAGMGGDGVDLSAARDLVVRGNVIVDAADKAVSVGEASRTTLAGNVLARAAIGIASKDTSETRSEGNTLAALGVALAAYRKKAFFGGALLRSSGDRILLADRRDRADARSRIEVDAAAQDGPPALRAWRDGAEAPNTPAARLAAARELLAAIGAEAQASEALAVAKALTEVQR